MKISNSESARRYDRGGSIRFVLRSKLIWILVILLPERRFSIRKSRVCMCILYTGINISEVMVPFAPTFLFCFFTTTDIVRRNCFRVELTRRPSLMRGDNSFADVRRSDVSAASVPSTC